MSKHQDTHLVKVTVRISHAHHDFLSTRFTRGGYNRALRAILDAYIQSFKARHKDRDEDDSEDNIEDNTPPPMELDNG